MNDSKTRDRAQYEKVRNAFEALGVQDKTAFVLEATFNTIGEALKETSLRFSDAFEHMADEEFWMGADEPAEPEAKKPPSRKKSSAKKSTSTRKKKDDAG